MATMPSRNSPLDESSSAPAEAAIASAAIAVNLLIYNTIYYRMSAE
jgi:hypothetical protein